MASFRLLSSSSLALILACLVTPPSASAAELYQQPPAPMPAILDAPRTPRISISPDQQWMLEIRRPQLQSIAEIAEPFVSIAGMRINPATNGPAREQGNTGLALKPLGPGEALTIPFPAGSRIRSTSWSRDSKRLAVTLLQDSGIELWVVDAATRVPRKLTGPILNAAYGSPCDWLPGDEGLTCKFIVADRGTAPSKPMVPAGPLVEQNLGRKTPNRTYKDLLQSPHDEALFDYYLTSTLDHVALDGTRTRISGPAVISSATPSHDGRYILTQAIQRPYSYQVPAGRFPTRIDVLDRSGKSVHLIADLPLADDVPITFNSVRKGPRQVRWRDDKPATLAWVEALDGGDAKAKADKRDALFELASPFTSAPTRLWDCEMRFSYVLFGRNDVALVAESWYDTRRTRTWRIDPSNQRVAPKLIFDRSSEDAYTDPGFPMLTTNRMGGSVLRFTPDGKSIYLEGAGASPEGVHPFLDSLELDSAKTTRLWRSADPHYESVVDVLDDEARRIVTSRQSKTEPPNYWLRTLATSGSEALTTYPDPAPQLAGIQQEVVKYKRDDGVELSATLYLPPGYDKAKDGPLPMFFWAYPQEYKSKEAAGRVTKSNNLFVRPLADSPLLLLTQGYGILDNPTIPIVGEGDVEPNDTYVTQLVAGAKAAVKYVTERGVGDPDRLAVGGHSYGAFMTANLLAHSDLFRAGIARSGAYNRTLTPFGFQGEQRNLWEAPETYSDMSPFMNAGSIKEPLLLIHGQDDSNPGTYPIQTERLYEAMKGLGGTVRWVVLPSEDHGYRSRESVGHVLWEMSTWLDEYVKRAPSLTTVAPAG